MAAMASDALCWPQRQQPSDGALGEPGQARCIETQHDVAGVRPGVRPAPAFQHARDDGRE